MRPSCRLNSATTICNSGSRQRLKPRRQGGKILQDWIGKFSVREKSRSNLVTEADEASQAAIVESLKSIARPMDFSAKKTSTIVRPGRKLSGSSTHSMAQQIMFMASPTIASPLPCLLAGELLSVSFMTPLATKPFQQFSARVHFAMGNRFRRAEKPK
jgi:hypothetical protein